MVIVIVHEILFGPKSVSYQDGLSIDKPSISSYWNTIVCQYGNENKNSIKCIRSKWLWWILVGPGAPQVTLVLINLCTKANIKILSYVNLFFYEIKCCLWTPIIPELHNTLELINNSKKSFIFNSAFTRSTMTATTITWPPLTTSTLAPRVRDPLWRIYAPRIMWKLVYNLMKGVCKFCVCTVRGAQASIFVVVYVRYVAFNVIGVTR